MYQELSNTLKVLADPNRLEIIDLLSCGEQCACDLLTHFSFSQPTLSHHMKVLVENDIAAFRKEGTKTMYSLNRDRINQTIHTLNVLNQSQSPFICDKLPEGDCSS